MAVDYFQKHIEGFQHRFNDTFGRLACPDTRLRTLVILGIIGLHLAACEIRQTADARQKKALVASWMARKTLMENVFSRFETARREAA